MNKLKELRNQSERRQADIAEEAGLSREYLSALENGRKKLSIPAARSLAKVYGTSPWILLDLGIEEQDTILREEHESLVAEIEDLQKKHANEIFLKQKEIDSLTEQVAQLKHSLEFAETMCKMLQKQINLLQPNLSERENA